MEKCMAASDTQKEIEDLKRQVAALSAARLAQAEATEPAMTEAPEESAPASEHDRAIHEHIEELVDLVGNELRDNPIATGVAIFVAGLLVGRLLR